MSRLTSLRTPQLLRHLARVVLLLWAVTIVTFAMIELLPGEPARAVLGEGATDEAVAAFNAEYGLDRNVVVRYADWASDSITGDFGQSTRTREPVTDAILERLPVTAELAVLAAIFTIVTAVPLALWAGGAEGSRHDRVVSAVSYLLISIPSYLLAVLLVYLFAVRLHILPATGWTRLEDDVIGNLRSAVLPALALGMSEAAVFTRVLRGDVARTATEEFVLAARARGMSRTHVLTREVLRPASFSTVTLAGVSLGRLLGGAVVIETIFGLPGLGQLVVQSIAARDLFTVQGVVLLVAVVYVVLNAAIDMAYRWLDPRTKLSVV